MATIRNEDFNALHLERKRYALYGMQTLQCQICDIPDRLPYLQTGVPVTMQGASLKTAYDRTALQRLGITFEAAMQNAMFKTCLTHIAEAIEKPYVPLPRHECANHWQPFKD